MRTFLLYFFLSLAIFSSVKSDILKVIDGDTINLNGENIRFSGIDAPESYFKGKKQICFLGKKKIMCGELSKNKLIEKIGDNFVKCIIEKKDKYKRSLGECYINGKSLSSYMVRNGYAFDWPYYSKNKFSRDQDFAKKNGLGLWSMEFEFPWEFRKKNK
tara:strand:+ start:724 stop:1200 length:477 start_codon:yes stop_codon:yes gene_type:complete